MADDDDDNDMIILSIAAAYEEPRVREVPILKRHITNLPWVKIYRSRSDSLYRHFMRMTCESFDELLRNFEPHFQNLSQQKTIRTRKRPGTQNLCFHPVEALGLGLVYLNTTCTQSHLCVTFGMIPSEISKKLNSALYCRGASRAHHSDCDEISNTE